MGIDVHSLNFLRYCFSKQSFSETATIGRHGYHILDSYTDDPFIRKVNREIYNHRGDLYCEDMLTGFFGSTKVESFDASDYEGATYIHDFNYPLPPEHHKKYRTVIDAGTLEHVFNVKEAFKNAVQMCDIGGQIIHILPANNFCGHGFYQFSPDFFFSYYCESRGFKNTDIFLASLNDNSIWWRVKEPARNSRAVVHTCSRTHILVRTVKTTDAENSKHIYQRDYVQAWKENQDLIYSRILLKPKVRNFFAPLYHRYYRLRPSPRMRLNRLNPCLERHTVKSLVAI